MQISIEPLRLEDARAVVEAEDEETVRWLSEEKSTIEGTTEFIARFARDAEQGKPKRIFGIWLDGDCVGTVDFDPDVTDGLEAGVSMSPTGSLPGFAAVTLLPVLSN